MRSRNAVRCDQLGSRPENQPSTPQLTCENAEPLRQREWTYLNSAEPAATVLFNLLNATQSTGEDSLPPLLAPFSALTG